LAAAQEQKSTAPKEKSTEMSPLLRQYVERFNRRDWDGLRELIAADARLQVTDRFLGPVSEAPYFRNYDKWSVPWKLATGEVDGESAVIVLGRDGETWTPRGAVHFNIENGLIVRIADYGHCPWLLSAAIQVTVEPS
jgi:RNA polymerase sigma-70 factor (ECF subfamily)